MRIENELRETVEYFVQGELSLSDQINIRFDSYNSLRFSFALVQAVEYSTC